MNKPLENPSLKRIQSIEDTGERIIQNIANNTRFLFS